MNDSQIVTQHIQYGSIVWNVVKKCGNSLTLIADPLPDPVAFYNPNKHSHAHYVRTDFSSMRSVSDPGKLFEIQNPPSPTDRENVQRYHDLMEYGSNQWIVSDIRHFLNTDFIDGLPADFKGKIIPQTHDLILGRTACSKSENTKTPCQSTSTGDLVYDEYRDTIRFTHGITVDPIYVPSSNDAAFIKELVQSNPSFDRQLNIWLIAAADNSSTPYLVEAAAIARDLAGNLKVYFDSNNARHPLHLCPMCVIKNF